MNTITINRQSGNYELIRNRDGRVMSEQPIQDAPIFYPMAYHMAQHQPHVADFLWRAAEQAAAGQVELISREDRRHRHEHDGISFRVATINSYEIREWHREPEAVAAPRPKPVYLCSCDFHRKANGKRPIIAGMPICKHILAGMMVRQAEIAPDYWQRIAAQQQLGRDTFGAIQREREAWEAAADEILATAEAQEIKVTARAKARRSTLNQIYKNHSEGWRPLVPQQEQPF